MTMTTDKAREARMRRKAASFDLRLIKSRSRNPDAINYGLYGLIDPRTNGLINPPLIGQYDCSWTLEDVERYLSNTSDLPTHSLEAQAEFVQTARVVDGAALVAIDTELRRRKRAALQQQTKRGRIATIVNKNAVAR